nr:hypothetical protein [uncultured Pedobacter sp.]
MLRTNIADREHKEIESYLELNLTKWLSPKQENWEFNISILTASYIQIHQ